MAGDPIPRKWTCVTCLAPQGGAPGKGGEYEESVGTGMGLRIVGPNGRKGARVGNFGAQVRFEEEARTGGKGDPSAQGYFRAGSGDQIPPPLPSPLKKNVLHSFLI